MQRNTYVLVSILAVLAALVVGVNLGKKLSPAGQSPLGGAPTPTAVVTPTPPPQAFVNTACGFSVQYTDDFTLADSATGSAILQSNNDANKSIIMTCQKNVPRPASPSAQIKKLFIPTTTGASVSATMYEDNSTPDGSTLDAVIFTHPTNKLDIFIAGYGDAFNALLKTIQVIQ